MALNTGRLAQLCRYRSASLAAAWVEKRLRTGKDERPSEH